MRMVHCFVCFRSISRSDMPGRFQHACAGRQTASRLRAEAEGEAPAASAKARGLSPGRKRRSAPSANGRESASDGFGAGLEGKSSVLRCLLCFSASAISFAPSSPNSLPCKNRYSALHGPWSMKACASVFASSTVSCLRLSYVIMQVLSARSLTSSKPSFKADCENAAQRADDVSALITNFAMSFGRLQRFNKCRDLPSSLIDC